MSLVLLVFVNAIILKESYLHNANVCLFLSIAFILLMLAVYKIRIYKTRRKIQLLPENPAGKTQNL